MCAPIGDVCHYNSLRKRSIVDVSEISATAAYLLSSRKRLWIQNHESCHVLPFFLEELSERHQVLEWVHK
jgi:hypothetical protein